MAHSTEHFNAVRDYLSQHGRQARQAGALERLRENRTTGVQPATGRVYDAVDLARIDRESATLESRLGVGR
jgi:hypothetical protein